MIPDYQWGQRIVADSWRGHVILQVDVQKGSFLAAFDLKSGKEVWAHAARIEAQLVDAYYRRRPGAHGSGRERC